jgi:HEAT repeat protein
MGEAGRVFDMLGYTDHYMETIRSGNRWEQAMAAERLGHMRRRRALPLLVEAMESSNSDLKLMAIYAAGLIGDYSVLPALINLLKAEASTGEEVSKRVLASSIISFGEAASRALAAELADPDWRVRAACLNLLAETGGARHAPLFTKMLSDPEQDVRAKAAKGLGRIRWLEASPLLEAALADRHWVVRLHSARALGLIRDAKSVPALIGKLTDRNWQVRRAVSEALGSIGGTAYLELLRAFVDSPDRYAKEQALDELGRSGAAAALLSMLPEGEYRYLLLKELPPANDRGGIRMELLVDMLLFLSSLDEESMVQALSSLECVADASGARIAHAEKNRIKEFGIRSRGFAEEQ